MRRLSAAVSAVITPRPADYPGTMSIQIDQAVTGRIKRAEIHAVVTRADGTVEDLGCIAATDFTLMGRIKSALRRIFGGNR